MCICKYIYVCMYINASIMCVLKCIIFFFSSTIVIKSGYFHMVGGFHASDGFSVLMEPPSQIILPDTN